MRPRRLGDRLVGPGLVLALGLLLYLPRLGVEILRQPLEATYALAAREMLRGGHLLVPHLFGELYPDKPPLYFWTTAALGWLRGGRIDEVTARLPAVVAALVGLLLVYRLGRDLFGRRAALFSALVLATSNLFFWYARQGHPDQFLVTFVTLACLGLWRGLAAARGDHPTAWIGLAYAAMGLGVLSKGLLGLVLPLLAGIAYAIATGPVRAVAARLRLGLGLGVFLATVLAWYGPAVVQQGRAYLYETLIHQHVLRYTRTWAHPGPWYYYFGEFPSGFFPWVLLLPGAIVLGWWTRDHAARSDSAGDAPAAPGPRPFLFPLAWFVTGFVFLSLSTSKRGAYLLPLYPAAALMVGWLWDRVVAGQTRSRWIGVPLAIISGAAVLLALGLVLVPRRLIPGRMVDTMVPADPRVLAAVVILLLAGAAAVWLPWRRGRPTLTLGTLVAVQALLLLAVATIRAPQYEARFPVREFVARVEAAVPPDRPVLSLLRHYDMLLAFYVDRRLLVPSGPTDIIAARSATEARYALVDDEERMGLDQPGTRLLAETRLDQKRVALIRLDPLPR